MTGYAKYLCTYPWCMWLGAQSEGEGGGCCGWARGRSIDVVVLVQRRWMGLCATSKHHTRISCITGVSAPSSSSTVKRLFGPSFY